MKVVFLDFDGVLNSEKFIRECGYYGVIIDTTRLLLVKKIIDATNAKIVLSTSWREHWDKDTDKCDDIGKNINDIFAQCGLNIFEKTAFLDRSREKEIEQWLKNHNDTENFVVLDDRFLDSAVLRNHFVKTNNYRDGIDEDNVKQAIEILNA